ncbi:MAG: sulfotransferase family 2 domain-containing protein [Bacteroidales bacterium]|nr:sulfotransferase family 2 domain-containing protein [Bacteroidales bacterium]
MVFNHEVLFIHLGKTGGMSVSTYMRKTLKQPVVDVVSKIEFKKINKKRVVIIGKRHANLAEAEELLKSQRLKLDDFKLIFAIVRNPVDIELSHYKHLQKAHVINRLLKYPELDRGRLEASVMNFDEFAKTEITHFQGELSLFFSINGKRPKNMKIVRFENLSTEVPEILRPYQVCTKPFPHKNKSDRDVNVSNLSNEAMLKIMNKYAWIYEQDFYPPLVKY